MLSPTTLYVEAGKVALCYDPLRDRKRVSEMEEYDTANRAFQEPLLMLIDP
jgi:hypothetical protein